MALPPPWLPVPKVLAYTFPELPTIHDKASCTGLDLCREAGKLEL
jgi:hypothetical protein